MTNNLILMTDSYKASHFLQYPQDTEYLNFYIEPRYSSITDEVVHFGLQIFLNEVLSKKITLADIEEVEEIFKLHGEPFNKEGWLYILNKHGGYLPVSIQSVPEGTVIPLKNVQVQIVNTDPKLAWLPGYLETALLRAVWYPSTVATISRTAKKYIKKYLDETSDIADQAIMFSLHDFGARGTTSSQQAGIGGAAHLVNFMGTDTVEGLLTARKHYNIDMPGFSIPAAEHSTIMAWSLEGLAYNNMIDKFGGPNKMYAVVSDTNDIYHAVDTIWGYQLVNKVKATGGTLVIRPDSGNPVTVTEYIMNSLCNTFGYTVNSKGFKVLDSSVKVIQGDGVDLNSIREILKNLKNKGYSTENIAFGMGAGLLQKVNRDTCGYAMKASAICQSGAWRGISKAPVTDGQKHSKSGCLALVQRDNKLVTVNRLDGWDDNEVDLLVPVFRNGEILQTWNMNDIRTRANI